MRLVGTGDNTLFCVKHLESLLCFHPVFTVPPVLSGMHLLRCYARYARFLAVTTYPLKNSQTCRVRRDVLEDSVSVQSTRTL